MRIEIENVEIFDIFGRELYSRAQMLTSPQDMAISSLFTGLCFVKIKTKMGEVVKKTVKQ